MKLTKEEREVIRKAREAFKVSWKWLGGYSRCRDLFNIIARQNNLKPVE